VDLDSQCLDVVGTIRSAGKVRQVELDLIPTIIQSHGHGTNERLDSGRGLVVGSPEPPSHVLIIEHLHFKGKVFLHVLDDHYQEWQLDAESVFWISWARDVSRAHIGSDNFKDQGLNVIISYSLDVAITHFLVPYLEWLASNTV